MKENPPQLSKKDLEKAKSYGGSEDPEKYRHIPDTPYYDKKDHAERSKYHQPNHNKHK